MKASVVAIATDHYLQTARELYEGFYNCCYYALSTKFLWLLWLLLRLRIFCKLFSNLLLSLSTLRLQSDIKASAATIVSAHYLQIACKMILRLL